MSDKLLCYQNIGMDGTGQITIGLFTRGSDLSDKASPLHLFRGAS